MLTKGYGDDGLFPTNIEMNSMLREREREYVYSIQIYFYSETIVIIGLNPVKMDGDLQW